MQSFNTIPKNAIKYETRRKMESFANHLGVCLDILGECYIEASHSGVSEERKEQLQQRFEFINDLLYEKRLDIYELSEKVSEL